MKQEAAVLRSTPLPVHCDCIRQNCNGEIVEFAGGCAREIFIRCDPATAWPEDGTPRKQVQGFYECLPWILHKADARMADVVLERVFFRDLQADFDAFSQVRKRAYGIGGVHGNQLPVASYIGQPPCTPGQAFELQVYALVPEAENTASVTTIPATAEYAAARIVEIDDCRHFYARNITGQGESFRAQSDDMFAQAAQMLARHDSTFQNVLRTWCYLDDIDRDYGEFNTSRNDFFRQEQVSRLPASTGIGATLRPRGSRCAMDIYALLDPQCAQIEVMHTSTLNEAPDYGSAFSRGMKVCLPEKTVLYISGTASVDESGATVHVGDPRGQLDRMLLNIEQLLAPHGADFTDLVQVISYLKSADNLPLFRDVAAKWGLTNLPNSVVQADICRPNFLCEMEAIAILPPESSDPGVSSSVR